MSADLIQGKKGSGKSKLAVLWMQQALLDDRKCATNLDLFLDKLMPPMSKATAIRIPDKPKAADLEAVGYGSAGNRYDPDQDGILVLDELATWMNARTFADKERGPVMDWFVHSRKKNWQTVLICQDMIQIDKQARESQVEYVTRCLACNKMRVPIIGGVIAALFGRKAGYLPRMHLATRRLGSEAKGLKAETWWYRGAGVEAGYDTLQEFSENYEHGVHSLLSAWHLVGRYLPAPLTFKQRVRKRLEVVFPLPGERRLQPKRPVVQLIARLPAAERIGHVRRLVRSGFL